MAFKVLHRYVHLTDLGHASSENNEADDVRCMRDLLTEVFDDWDIGKRGFLDKPAFVHMVRHLLLWGATC